MFVTDKEKENLMKEIINIILENEAYSYILEKDIHELKYNYADFILDQINDTERLKEGIDNNFSNKFRADNLDLYWKIFSTIDKVLAENLNYTKNNIIKNKDYIWTKKYKNEDEYYLYIIELASELAIDFNININENESCIKITFDFINNGKLTPNLFLIDESFNSNLRYISSKVPRKIIEIYSGSTNNNCNGLLIYSMGDFLSTNANNIINYLFLLLYEFKLFVYI